MSKPYMIQIIKRIGKHILHVQWVHQNFCDPLSHPCKWLLGNKAMKAYIDMFSGHKILLEESKR